MSKTDINKIKMDAVRAGLMKAVNDELWAAESALMEARKENFSKNITLALRAISDAQELYAEAEEIK